ncbi:helix-turn-helix domain-containing protein [Catenuloplanes nepalensis]|uniref:helix-turn-helix domain-containing protein n=1 Tax=Catenuloplanes nepalensis TaxID=587533 RepID=UPI0027D8F412|nr:helix-turn-helix domain-containing protein [Catenuloplanes nepalensis]
MTGRRTDANSQQAGPRACTQGTRGARRVGTGATAVRRLVAARDALAGDRLTISEAAARWQFSDASHFTRQFRHRYGTTPREFARQRRP